MAEVDFPIATVSKHAAREKAIRHGLPSNVHLWWARRPLAACRAMLLALLLPDPCEVQCPTSFKKQARELLRKVMGSIGKSDEDLRKGLLRFIGDFANWDLASDRTYLEVGRGLVKAAYSDEKPMVVDPFAGGGSIPLEALRLECDTFASDLNPVACLILKVMLEDIPRHGPELGENLRRIGTKIKAIAEKELVEFYPTDPDGAHPIAYLWARTVRCESPNCGAEIPLSRSLWLCKKAKHLKALHPQVIRSKGKPPDVLFEIIEPANESEVYPGTVSRAKATCLSCNTVLAPNRVRAQLREQNGGPDVVFDKQGKRIGGARLLAVVTLRPGEQGRHYRLPNDRDYATVWKALKKLEELTAAQSPTELNLVPDEPLPLMSGTFNAPIYGASNWGLLFTARQKLALATLCEKIGLAVRSVENVEAEIPALAFSKFVELATANCPWEPVAECPRKIFNMQAIPTRWEFAEAVCTSDSSGGFSKVLDNFGATLDSIGANWAKGQCQLADACHSPLPDQSCDVWFTDPPYYFAVPYADLSDFFFVWLKRVLPRHPLLRDPFDQQNPLTPKDQELCQMAHWDRHRYAHKDKEFFEQGMFNAFSTGKQVLRSDGIGCVVFAHKTTEGWEALLSALIRGGWVITASWPILTEQTHRPRARDSAALATSVHLVCRPRHESAVTGDWGEVIRELPPRVTDWMEYLQTEGVRGADLVFACIGPALEIFSQYSKVETAEGEEVKLDAYLEKVWEVVGRTALEQVLGSACPFGKAA